MAPRGCHNAAEDPAPMQTLTALRDLWEFWKVYMNFGLKNHGSGMEGLGGEGVRVSGRFDQTHYIHIWNYQIIERMNLIKRNWIYFQGYLW